MDNFQYVPEVSSPLPVHTPKNWNGTRKQLTGLIGREYHCRRAIEKLDLQTMPGADNG